MQAMTKCIGRLLLLLVAGAFAQAIAEQLRRPSEDRTWTGKVAGVVPYDLRPPTPARLKESFWAPDKAYLTPHSFGVGWSPNLGRMVYELRHRGDTAED
jgi:hypothetical protein